jgi:hypothetical protein
MSNTDDKKGGSNRPAPLSMKELTAVLAKHYGLKAGKYDLEIEFQIGTGPVGPSKEELVPGVILGVKCIGLAPAKQPAPSSVDVALPAAEKLPAPPKKRIPRKKD